MNFKILDCLLIKEWTGKTIYLNFSSIFGDFFWIFFFTINQSNRKRVKENRWKGKSKSWYIKCTPCLRLLELTDFNNKYPYVLVLMSLQPWIGWKTFGTKIPFSSFLAEIGLNPLLPVLPLNYTSHWYVNYLNPNQLSSCSISPDWYEFLEK